MDELGADAPDWEILKLLREVRRRVRAGDPQRFLSRLEQEPRWVAALPPEEAKVARTMLDATRELARRAVEAKAGAVTASVDEAPLPRRTKTQERRNLALARQADALANAVELTPAASRRRRRK